ncbi:MAG: phytoene/squalene synthase family protein [Bacteroidales bacterium]|nr:phytoene/squalene synthase family protein [Bacteroidales bacterium]
MERLYNDVAFRISRLVTKAYSTSFSLAVSCLKKEKRDAIYSIYGFVRFADEIVDTFHDYSKQELLSRFEAEYYTALKDGISLNPVLHSFQLTVKKYDIPDELIRAFLESMKADLSKTGSYTKPEIERYIYGSAEVVGLMCLIVFVNGDKAAYEQLMRPARKLGSAFQKVNFLRDLGADYRTLNRSYFPDIDVSHFSESDKQRLVNEITAEFDEALSGIRILPRDSRLPVFTAYLYYRRLLKKIGRTPAGKLVSSRIRVNDFMKSLIMAASWCRAKMNLV